MRAAARRIMEQFAPESIPAEPDAVKINALEAPAGECDDIIPSTWTEDHVAKRLVEAFETISKQPPLRGPRAPGNAWPEIMVEWEDQLAQLHSDAADKRARSRNRVRILPSAIDLQRMEIVLGWLSDLYRVDPGLCRAVQRWAHLRAEHRSIKADCRATGLSFQIFYRQRDKGIAKIIEAIGTSAVW